MKVLICLLVLVFASYCHAGQLDSAGCLALDESVLSWFPGRCPDGDRYVFTYHDGTPVYDPSEITNVASDWAGLMDVFTPLGCCPGDKIIACLIVSNTQIIDTCDNGMSCCTDENNNYTGCNWVCK